MSDLPNIPLTDDPPYDRDRELVFWMLPTDVGDQRERGGRDWAIDRLARRLLRYSFLLSTAFSNADFELALERREALLNRLERVTVRDRLRYFEGEAVDLVMARAHQIIDPDRFRPTIP